jgi:hypothetical protein
MAVVVVLPPVAAVIAVIAVMVAVMAVVFDRDRRRCAYSNS